MPPRLPALIADPPPSDARVWLENARLLDGTGAPPREHVSVLVESWLLAYAVFSCRRLRLSGI